MYTTLYMLKVLKKSYLLFIVLLITCFACDRYDSDERYGTEMGKELPESSLNRSFSDQKESEPKAKDLTEELNNEKRAEEQSLENKFLGAGFTGNFASVKPDTGNKIYSGYGELKVDVVEEAKKQVTKIAETSGGYVEDVYEDSITIRVPAQQFNELFKQILLLGEVLNKSIETIDVTEYYTDLKARLQISIKTRARLYALLARTQDVKEQLEILKEIKRLSEEIERITLELKLVENQIRYSRITIRLIPRITQSIEDQKKIPFNWIANLNPLFPSLTKMEGAIELNLEEDFAVFSQEAIFRAESADGVRVRMGTTKNIPKGDTDFWQQALDFHLKKFYRETKTFDEDLLQGVILKSKDSKPFYYLIAVAVKNEKIFVIEVFFPDEPVYNQKYPGITRALKDFKLK